MKIRNDIPLVLSDLYEYDFSMCSYQILKNIGWDLSHIETEDKTKRNIQIGLLQRDNPKLSQFLQNEVKNLIDYYLSRNNILDNEIVLRQFDGVILKKPLHRLTETLPLDHRSNILKFIVSPDRASYLALLDNGTVKVKGVSNLPVDASFYNLFKNLDFGNFRNLVNQLENIRIVIIGNNSNILWHCHLNNDGNYLVPIEDDLLILRPSVINSIDVRDVNKFICWEKYVWNFVSSLLVSFTV
ncbi:MAG: hypothetical protein ACOCQD_02250 [archaeon]